MIFLDANFFLRYIVRVETEEQSRMQRLAENFMLALETGAIEATTSEVVLHEVCYVMTSRRQYGASVHEAITALEPILRLSALKFPPGDKEIYLRALSIWQQYPKLEFADSVIAARCEVNGWELATFDETLGSLPSITRWQPAEA
jgi:predicted nucleic acid-binding protein